ncbi:hypothetical protein C8Q76DRAFT_800199 [Earliella scabrosa]|nr:hypothetical protein C8Q76DRAFT_800199 [Earliella scabrosa]
MNTTITWQEEPHFRGTFSILTSCLSTLFVSTWSALHLDIPESGERGQSAFMRFLDKLGWFVIGLLAPEYLLLIAFNQYLAARSLTKLAQEQLDPPPEPPYWFVRVFRWITASTVRDGGWRNRKHPWTLTHSFFAIMGGFVLQDPHVTPEHRYLPAWQGNGVLTEYGVQALIRREPEFIPDIPVDELLDRGKADGLAKLLLTWQMLWFCLSCLNRGVQHLPLSLLEVTTIAHALCALLTYAAWWKKPKDVGQPIVIGKHPDVDQQHLRSFGAWLSTLSRADRSLLFNGITLSHNSEYNSVIGEPRDAWSKWLNTHDQQARNLRYGPSDHTPSCSAVILRPFSAIRHLLAMVRTKYIFYWRPLPWYVKGSSIDWAELQATKERMSLLPSSLQAAVYVEGFISADDDHPLVVPVARIQATTHSALTAKSRTGIGLALLPAVYGFPHLIGLTATFPTVVEHWIWRWTTVAIIVLGVGTFCTVYMLMLFGEWFTSWFQQFGKTIAMFNVLVYFVGSMYLVMESFRQLFALSPESFTLPSWGYYWPHFS